MTYLGGDVIKAGGANAECVSVSLYTFRCSIDNFLRCQKNPALINTARFTANLARLVLFSSIQKKFYIFIGDNKHTDFVKLPVTVIWWVKGGPSSYYSKPMVGGSRRINVFLQFFSFPFIWGGIFCFKYHWNSTKASYTDFWTIVRLFFVAC